MFGNFLLKQMLKRQGISDEQAESVLKMVEKNPGLFQQIALEIKEKVKSGKSEQEAAVEVMAAHQEELKKLNP